ncbi:HPr kinase/phosphorylase [Rhodoplanes azumiensis]|uniref:HPr kinase/phosphorylase n=1 Tax=Rhodoplanes azumiensis TaxID=1897628 RepID=A0ABW5AHZ9_9BRAD
MTPSTVTPTIHATAVLVGRCAVLIRGPSGSGKSRLALRLIEAAVTAGGFARLVADDRTIVTAVGGRLLARPPENLAGMIEVRGIGVDRHPHEPVAVVGLVVDLADPQAERLPAASDARVVLEGVSMPRLRLPAGVDPLPAVLAALARLGPAPVAPP